MGYKTNKKGNNRCEKPQTHVHEFLGSTKLAGKGEERHNHRFAGVSGEVIPYKDSHIHKICTGTDFFGHFRRDAIKTGPAIDVGHGKHVHFVKGKTTFEDSHVHNFVFATMIDSPLM